MLLRQSAVHVATVHVSRGHAIRPAMARGSCISSENPRQITYRFATGSRTSHPRCRTVSKRATRQVCSVASATSYPVPTAPEPERPTVDDGLFGLLHSAMEKGVGSVLLLAATATSLWLANHQALGGSYIALWDVHFGLPQLGLFLSLREWINEGLMALFFFVVGLDIKREFVHGSLRNIKQAVLPCLGALGGMVAPMAVCLALNMQPGGVASAWAVPMATDIAFAMGVYTFFKHRMPAGMAAFLLTLATVDDLGAIAVIALCYAGHIAVPFLAGASACCVALAALHRRKLHGKGVTAKRMTIFAALGVALWYCLLRGGINADVAGVLTAMAIPIDAAPPPDSKAPPEHDGVPPTLVDHLIYLWVPLTSLFIMPLFALANTAVPLGGAVGSPAALLSLPVAQGIGLGLLLGKPLGIMAFCMLGIKMGLAKWPTGMGVSHLGTVGVLGGIGFTMSLFLVEMSLSGVNAAAGKLAILAASVTAAIAGATLLAILPAYKPEPKKVSDRTALDVLNEQHGATSADVGDSGEVNPTTTQSTPRPQS